MLNRMEKQRIYEKKKGTTLNINAKGVYYKELNEMIHQATGEYLTPKYFIEDFVY